MNAIPLPGCTPEPLMSYLKALGVFRLVAEQADPSARGCWRGGEFVLETTLDRDALTAFFLKQYKPTPILAPWNGGSGFYDGGKEPLEAIGKSENPALGVYRDAIKTVRGFVPDKKPKDDDKESLLVCCRAALSDEVVPWLDVCFVLGKEGPGYFPLLGTGANDGRLDFTNNFMQRLADVIAFAADSPPPASSAGWLASALFADDPALTAYEKAAVGQFNPGGIGGANGVQGNFEANSRVNPWDFVLMIEGALLFAGSVARRLGANSGDRAVFPFTVGSVAVGYGSSSASEETRDGSRAELWLPLWDESAGFAEVRQLFAEGRAQVNRRQAKNAVEFALAVNLLGVSRGVTAFTRYGFLKRNGLAFLAAPLGRVAVTPRPAARLLEDPPLRDWIDHLRRACRDKERTPARYQTALRRIDRAVFDFATRSQTDLEGERRSLLGVLRALGQAERTLANGLRFCKEENLHPLQGLNPRWLLDAVPRGPGAREFRLAASLASVVGERGQNALGPLRVHLEEIEQPKHWAKWSPGSTSTVWSNRPLAENLAAVFLRRWMEGERAGAGLGLRARVFAPLPDVVAFVNGETDDELLTDLLWALVGLKWTAKWIRRKTNQEELRTAFRVTATTVAPQEFGLLRLVARPVGVVIESRPVGRTGDRELVWSVADAGSEADLITTPTAGPFHQLRRRDCQSAVEDAAHRLWSDRLTPFGWVNRYRRRDPFPTDAAVDPIRLLAACLFPLSRSALTRLARQALAQPVPKT